MWKASKAALKHSIPGRHERWVPSNKTRKEGEEGQCGKDRKVEMKNKAGTRRMDTPDWNSTREKTLPAAALLCLKWKLGQEEGVENWHKTLYLVPMQNQLKRRRKRKTFTRNPERQKFCSRTERQKKQRESYCKISWLVISYACRYSGVWGLCASEAFFYYCWQRGIWKIHRMPR